MADHPAYSVVVPAYNAAHFIAEAIGSALNQTCAPAEIIVVDDGSDDDTGIIAGAIDPRVKVLRQDNAGPGAATNAAVAAAAGSSTHIAGLDADDIWLPEKIERQFAFLEAKPGMAGVFCEMEHFRHDTGDTARTTAHWGRSVMLIKREVYEKTGDMIDPGGGRGDFVDWLARARERGFAFGMIEEVLARRRIHPASMSYARDNEKDRGYLEVARLAILRRRARAKTQ